MRKSALVVALFSSFILAINSKIAFSQDSQCPPHAQVSSVVAEGNIRTFHCKCDIGFENRSGQCAPIGNVEALKSRIEELEKTLGPAHPSVWSALIVLADLYVAQGRYADAEPLYRRALAIQEKALGSDYSETAQSLEKLASLYQKQGRPAEAEPLYKRSLAIYEKIGSEQLKVATTLHNLAGLFASEARYSEAEELLSKSLTIQEMTFGPESTQVAATLVNLAEISEKQGNQKKAEGLRERAATIRREIRNDIVQLKDNSKTNSTSDEACRTNMRLKGVIFSPSERCYDPDELVAQLKSGTYSFNKPEYAYTNESFNVVLLLKTADGQDVISRFRGLQGSREERIAPVAQYLEATLRGADFKIDPSAPQPQSITTQAPVEWHWSVTPLKSGDKMLIIDVFADLQIGAEKHHVQLKVLEVPIQIRVDTLQWIKSAFTEASGFIVALAAALTALIGAISPLRHWVLRLFRRT